MSKATSEAMTEVTNRSVKAPNNTNRENQMFFPTKLKSRKLIFTPFQYLNLLILLTVISSFFFVTESPSQVTKTTKLKKAHQYCTAIKVPISTNLPVTIEGQTFKSPQEYSAAFKPILSVVELPKGYKAVGGGAGFVIACTK